MTVNLRFRPIIFALMAASSVYAAADPACEGLTSLTLDDVAIVTAAFVEAAPLKPPAGLSGKRPEITIPHHCEVKGVARPTSDSEIGFILWLPPAKSWNGKFVQGGNGGWAGSIQQTALVLPLMRGYAVAATDDGHYTGALFLTHAGPLDILRN